LIVMAVTDPNVSAYQGTSMFIVPTQTQGVKVLRDLSTMERPTGWEGRFHAGGYGHSEILFEEVRLPATAILGEQGSGFALAQKRLGPGRLHHCMRWLGQARRAFDMMCERAVSRYAHGSLLSEKGIVQTWIADSAAEMLAARLMTLYAAWMVDQGGASSARLEISLIKFYGAQVLYNVIDRAIQVHGGLGYSTDLPLESMYRNARAARLYDGPDEVHRVSVARRILRQYVPTEVPTESVPSRRAEAVARFAAQLEAATAND
jgi:acyl-CoA dehydrogenase